MFNNQPKKLFRIGSAPLDKRSAEERHMAWLSEPNRKWLLACYRKGEAARRAGEPIGRNPYGDDVQDHGGVNFNRARWRAWRDGWKDADQIVSNDQAFAE